MLNHSKITRRQFMYTASLAAGFFVVPGAFAEELMRAAALRQTAWVMEGPFYPEKLPLDMDNDLIVVDDSITPAVGEITQVAGRVLDARSDPVKDAVVEIWQVDHNAIYLAERDSRSGFDPKFQGFGRFETGSSGEYRFRTIKPVVYPGRLAPHIHFKIKTPGRDPWTTQLYIKGYAGNQQDRIYRGIGDAKAQESVTVEFAPIKDSRIGELAAKFDIVLGFTAKI
jgi:protocatechuate 3,4-dioxygenase beta subunit